jgi:hypothetical protein
MSLFLISSIIGGGYWIYNRIISGLAKQIELGVAYSQSDLDTLITNFNTTASETNIVDVVITSAQATAFVNSSIANLGSILLEDIEIKFSEDKVEISTILAYKGSTFPIYVSGNISRATNTSIYTNLYDVKIGDISIPKSLQDYVEAALESKINEKLATSGDALRIDDIEFVEDGMHIVGLIPNKGDLR